MILPRLGTHSASSEVILIRDSADDQYVGKIFLREMPSDDSRVWQPRALRSPSADRRLNGVGYDR